MFGLFHKSNDKPLSQKGLEGVLSYSQKSSRDVAQLADNNRISANNLMTYGSHLGDDLTDVTSKLGHLLNEWSNVLMEFSDSIDQYRETLKSIAHKEATLQPGRDQKRKIRDQIERLQSSMSSMDKVSNLKEQLAQLEQFTAPDEVEMGNFKRIATREGLYLLLNGMHAMASKTDIISTFGKYIVDELDVHPVQVGEQRKLYEGEEKTKRVEEDARRAIAEWNPDKTKVRRTLTSHHGHNPLVVKKLPPAPPKEDSCDDLPASASGTEENKDDEENEDEAVDIPSRTVSLEEQNKQFSFYKPDDIVDDVPSPQPSTSTSTSTSTTQQQQLSGGFSNMYLHHTSPFQQQQQLHPHLNQQNLYQFYQHYLPPRPYDEMKNTFSSGAVFRGGEEAERHDAGGFVLPSTNPNFHPNPSMSSRSVSSVHSNSDNNSNSE